MTGTESVGAVRAEVELLLVDVKRRVHDEQRGVPTFCDNLAVAVLDVLRRLPSDLEWRHALREHEPRLASTYEASLERLRDAACRRRDGRFVTWQQRGGGASATRDVGRLDLLMSQGAHECLHWKGMPLFKTAFDASIYAMLVAELRPATVIELGSGTGSSAVWLADLLHLHGVQGHIYSLDIQRPSLRCDSVTFLEGDVAELDRILAMAQISAAPHPWLVIEDAHAHVAEVLRCLDRELQASDYLVIEDSDIKRHELDRFLAERSAAYRVDTRYTDFFGHNATCAADSILRRTE